MTANKALLGKALFWDEQLSATRSVACGTCHIPSKGGSDPRTGAAGSLNPGFDKLFGTPDDVRASPGVVNSLADGSWQPVASFGLDAQVTPRKTPSMINAAYVPQMFWDGRATPSFADPVTGQIVLPFGASLESQAAAPPVSSVEMAHVGQTWSALAGGIDELEPLRLASQLPLDLAAFVDGRTYGELFELAFGTPGISATRAVLALASYQRTLLSDQSPWDSFLAGNPGALTPQQQNGRALYFGQGRCAICHGGQLLTNNLFQNTGVRPIFEDLGRGAITGIPADNGRFKTPTLRNVALRAPFFHNGGMATLLEVVDFYNRGGDFHVNQDPAIVPLGLNLQQRQALVAFLQAFTDPRVAAEQPPFDRPRLYSESAHVPSALGAPTAGSGGFAPRMLASEPPALGNPELTLAVDRALGGAPVVLGVDALALPGGWQALGATLYLGLSPAVSILPLGALHGSGAGNGWTSKGFALPADAALLGQTLSAQWVVLDPGSAGGLAASAAAQLALF